MNLQNIERLKQLLGRVERNAKQPRTNSQGLVAYLGAAAPAAGRQTAESTSSAATALKGASPDVRAPAAVALGAVAAHAVRAVSPVVSAPVAPAVVSPIATAPAAAKAAFPAPMGTASRGDVPVAPVASPPESLPPDQLEAPASQGQIAGELEDELLVEDVSFDEVSAVELPQPEDIEDEIPIEISSSVASEAPLEPEAERAAAGATPYTAPPSLDELTFSEPPPPNAATEIEPPPISTAQPMEPPGSIDAALLAATEGRLSGAEAEREPPAVTPPPESGPQVAVPPIAAPGLPTGMAADAARAMAPTAEQLGDVIELEQASGPPLELEERKKGAPKSEPASGQKSTAEELEFVPAASTRSQAHEAREPLQTLVGGFDEELGTGEEAAPETPPPAAARVVIPTHERPPTEPRAIAAAPVQPMPAQPSLTLPAGGDSDFVDEAPTASSSRLAPEVIERKPVVMARPTLDVISAAQAYRPRSFLELLDSSMGLLKK